MKEMPSRLYKFYSFSTQSLACLKKRVIFFARPSRFNDPFDCRVRFVKEAVSHDDMLRILECYGDKNANLSAVREICRHSPPALEQMRARLEPVLVDLCRDQLKKTFSNRGVCCFAATRDHLLLWGHYADGHRGFCLEFDTSFAPFSGAEPVSYKPAYTKFSPTQVLLDPAEAIFEAAMRTKSTDWSYEEEWRLFHEQEDTEHCYPVESLTGLYFGAEMEFVHKELLALVVRGSSTKLYEMHKSADGSSVLPKPVEYTPHPHAGGSA